MYRLIVCFLFSSLITCGLYSDPWGKDAGLCKAYRPCPNACSEVHCPSILSSLAEGLIQFHQDIISPADGPRSHFIPSSSQYTREAIYKYGFYQGFTMGCDRLMRENDDKWIYRTVKMPSGKTLKLNPVP